MVDHYDKFPNIPVQLSTHPLMIFMSRELGCFQTNVIHLRSVYFSVPPKASLSLTKCDVKINIKKGVWGPGRGTNETAKLRLVRGGRLRMRFSQIPLVNPS